MPRTPHSGLGTTKRWPAGLLIAWALATTPALALPDLTAVKTNDTSGVTTVGTPFTWSIRVDNIGATTFTIGATFNILRDELPNTNMSYGTPFVSSSSGLSGTMSCTINASFRLACLTDTLVTLAAGGHFTVSFTATPSAAGVFDNPRAGQICRADPDTQDAESNESNNDCSDSVAVTTGASGPDLTVTKSNNVGGSTEVAAGAWTWSLAIANGGDTEATFASGQAIVSDDLPNSSISYGSVTVGSQSGISGSGSISCSVASSNLTCTASGGSVVLAAGSGSFAASFPATPSIAGAFVNPRGGGTCGVDPGDVIVEGDEANNSCADTVSVSASPDLTATKTNDTGGSATVGTPFTWSIRVDNIGGTTFTIGATFNILRDELPNTNMSYGTPFVSSSSGLSGTMSCTINASFRLACLTDTLVTLAAGGHFTVSFTATPSAAGVFDNPRAGQICRADPDTQDAESNESNNDCSDSVATAVSCGAADGLNLTIMDDTLLTAETFEVCLTLTVGPNYLVMGPNGHLTARAGQSVTFVDGFAVGVDGQLTVETDSSLLP